MKWKDKVVRKQIGLFIQRMAGPKKEEVKPVLLSFPKIPPLAAKPVKAKKVKPKGKVRNRSEVLELRWGVSTPQPHLDVSKPLSNGYNFGAWLTKRGFKRLGSGAYSTIYGKDGSDRVIKVTAGSQDNWIDYIQWSASKGYCGTLAPRVYSWKKFKIADGEFSVSVVERMSETIDQATKSDPYILQHLMWPAMSGHTLAQCYMEDIVPGSLKFFMDLKERFPGGHDLYGKNMMLRKDGTFCVTDPVCGRSTIKVNRLRSADFTSVAPAIRGFVIANCF